MKKSYLITVPVRGARGTQTFEVMANGPADAIKRWKENGATFVSEEISVTDIGEPSAELNE